MMTSDQTPQLRKHESGLQVTNRSEDFDHHSAPETAESMGKALLRIASDDQKESLHYAARMLLSSAGLNIPLDYEETLDHDTRGLTLPGGSAVSANELESIFTSLSLERERIINRRDRLGRFDENTITWDISKPWVDLRALELASYIVKQNEIGTIQHPTFSVHITHDIDRTTFLEPWSILTLLHAAFGLWRTSWESLRTMLSSNALARGIDHLLDYERSNAIGAHYFLMSGPYGMGRYSTRTDLNWSSWKAIAKLIQDAGMRIGLHGSFTAKDRNSYREEKERLEQALGNPVKTHRNHYLRFDPVRICCQLEAAGIEYDFSIGYSTQIGFRSGSAKIHRMFDLYQQSTSRLFSVPLLFMDSRIITRDLNVAFKKLCHALEEVKTVKGSISLLFHPEDFLIVPTAWPFFQRVIGFCHELGADLSGRLP